MKNKDIISHLKDDIKTSIINDVKKALGHYEENKSGFHSLPRIIFCYIDYLGALVYGKNGTENAVQYVDSHFKDEYKKISSVLIEMWRHGTVHEYDPKVLTNGNFQLGWLTNISDERQNRTGHLRIYRSKDEAKKLSMKININQLTDDLLSSVDRLIDNLTSNAKERKKVQENYLKISSERHINNIRGKAAPKVKKQFDDILERVSGVLDGKGNVLKELKLD